MADISAKAVKELRDKTNLPMMEVKKALMEANGDEEQAIEILRRNVGKVMLKRAENATSEGVIRVLTTDDGKVGAMVEVQCESAPVAKADDFTFLADQCVKQLLTGPGAATVEELLAQTAPDRAGATLQSILDDVVNKIREKIVVARAVRVEGPVGGYVHHDGKTGVLVVATGENGAAPVIRDVAMHVAALRPAVTHPEELDAAAVKTERDRLSTEAAASGKPANIVEKIVDGRMKTYYGEQGVLTFQMFAKDDSKTVSQALAETGLKAKSFIRWVLGN
ncbi:MAG: translation elongation factor Ts [Planctomycetales bacterium 12-60-4]|nr:MAG: translation elongation factor Ts [Planctomycetales bacterium 12-60-4]